MCLSNKLEMYTTLSLPSLHIFYLSLGEPEIHGSKSPGKEVNFSGTALSALDHRKHKELQLLSYLVRWTRRIRLLIQLLTLLYLH